MLEQAAAIWESLTLNHPFVDGNKRVGLAVLHAFLKANGWKLMAHPKALETFILVALETGTFKYTTLLEWLKENICQMNVDRQLS